MIFDLISNSPHDLHSYTVNLKENIVVYQSLEPLFQTSSVTGDSRTCNQITVLFHTTCNNSQIFFAVGLNSSKRMSHQIRRNSNSVSSSPTHPQAKVDILINNERSSHFISAHQSSPAVEPTVG